MIYCLCLEDHDGDVRNFLEHEINSKIASFGHKKFDLDNDSRVIVIKDNELCNIPVAQSFETVLCRIEKEITQCGLNEVTILVNKVRIKTLKADTGTETHNQWGNLLGMLILAFPEIRWIICNSYSSASKIDLKPFILPEHTLAALYKPIHTPLFDSTGLRNLIKGRTKGLPTRANRAASIDEESSYALFHAYTTYRFGYRAEPVCSWELMQQLFSESDTSSPSPHGFHLLLEDVNLSFPDKPENIHLSTFKDYKNPDTRTEPGRAYYCSRLNETDVSDFRIIITSGHSGNNTDNSKTNLAFVEEYKGREKSGYVPKPVGGMFDLWTQAKLSKRLPRHQDNNGIVQQGYAPGFYWPPLPKVPTEDSHHSAPGKLMLIAQHLVRRADAMLASANTVEECIRGAVLATDALELLGFQTPTLALQALSLKHEFEVKAEVAFLGVGHHFLIEPRIEELERDVKVAAQYFQKKRRRLAELDTLVSIGNHLVLIFRNAGQFDEESKCLIQVRKWHRELQRLQTRDPFTLAGHWVMTYVEWLVVSPRHFVLAFVGWYLVLAGLWYGLHPFINKPEDGIKPLWFALTVSFNTFVAASPEKAKDTTSFILNGLGLTSGLFHLGVFVAYLYSIISRK